METAAAKCGRAWSRPLKPVDAVENADSAMPASFVETSGRAIAISDQANARQKIQRSSHERLQCLEASYGAWWLDHPSAPDIGSGAGKSRADVLILP
jgi:hypothetical protein